MPKRNQRKPPHERVLARIEIDDNGCWTFQGTLRAGYGRVFICYHANRSKTEAFAHRVVYEGLVGPIPDGLTIDHLCFNRACVNPAHLEAVTNAENLKRAWAAGRMHPNKSRQEATHCKNGHEWTPENTRQDDRQRYCRACGAERQRKRRAALRSQ